ncbi:conserved hypothetical protein [delta proteobacterium NaphS2]|nr:conserved hypothetical protein [delta proteobacterium NaphS2]
MEGDILNLLHALLPEKENKHEVHENHRLMDAFDGSGRLLHHWPEADSFLGFKGKSLNRL